MELTFEQQIDSNYSEMYRFALKLTTNPDKARDLLHDCFLLALRFRTKFKGGNLRAWLGTLMYNTFINDYRKNRRKRNIIDSEENSESFRKIQNKITSIPTDSYIQVAEIWKEVEALKPFLKEPLKMHLSGYKYEEIAEILEIPMGSVKSRIFQARQKLIKSLHYGK